MKRAVFAEARNSVHCLGSFRRSFVQASGQHQPLSHPWGSVSPVKHVVMNVEDILKKVVTFKTEQLDKSLRPHPLTLQVNAEVEICIFIYNILSNKSSAWSNFILCSSKCFTAKKKRSKSCRSIIFYFHSNQQRTLSQLVPITRLIVTDSDI